MKYGSGVRDLTQDTNTVYTHPSTKQCNYSYTHPAEKQCNYNVDLSNYVTKSDLGASIKTNVINNVSGTLTYDTPPVACMLLLYGTSYYWQNYGPFVIPQGFATERNPNRGYLYDFNKDDFSDSYISTDEWNRVANNVSLSGTTFTWTCTMDRYKASYPEKSFVVAFFS